MLAAKVWHAWIAYPLLAATVLAGVGLIAGYVRKVVRPRYPK